MPISPPSANLDHIINTLKWATLLSLHLSPFLAPGTTYFYLFEKIFFRVSPCWSPPRGCRRRRACSPCTTWCCGSPRIAPGGSNDHRDILYYDISMFQVHSIPVTLLTAQRRVTPSPARAFTSSRSPARVPGTWHVASSSHATRSTETWELSYLGSHFCWVLNKLFVAVCVTLPYCYCSPLLKHFSPKRTLAFTLVIVGCVKVQHTIVLCFVCSSLLLCLGLGTVGLIDYFQCS